jgi:hypothetical protein
MNIPKISFLILAAATITGCGGAGGGGGGGGGGTTAITVKVAKNPALVNYSTTVTASFANFTGAVHTGSTVTFAVSAPATLNSTTAVTSSSGVATAHVKSAQPGVFVVSASAKTFAGSAPVTFINQPGSVIFTVGLNKTVAGMGMLSLPLASDSPAVFRRYTSFAPVAAIDPAFYAASPDPLTPSSLVLYLWQNLTGYNVPAALPPILRMTYDVTPPGIPVFSIVSSGNFIRQDNTLADYVPPLTRANFVIKPTYFSGPGGTGTALFTTP